MHNATRLPWKLSLLTTAVVALFALNQNWASASFTPPEADSMLVAATCKRVAALDLTADERRWEDVKWMSSLDEALARSRRLNRPIFMLALAGDLDGRC